MQDDDKKPTESLDPDARTSSHDQLNRPGMTNGIPDQASDAQATGRPRDERQQSENAATNADGGSDSGSGS